MENFNKYLFIENLKSDLLDYADSETNYNEMSQFLAEEINNACIYTADCFAICKALNATEFGNINNITNLAFNALFEYVNNEIDLNELLEQIKNI